MHFLRHAGFEAAAWPMQRCCSLSSTCRRHTSSHATPPPTTPAATALCPPAATRRHSRGGVAVQQQYRSVVRLMKEARQQGRRGTSYVDLVQQALAALPDK